MVGRPQEPGDNQHKFTNIRFFQYLRETRKIDERQVQDIWAIYPQMNWQLAYTLILPRNAECFILDLLPDVIEVRKTAVEVEDNKSRKFCCSFFSAGTGLR